MTQLLNELKASKENLEKNIQITDTSRMLVAGNSAEKITVMKNLGLAEDIINLEKIRGVSLERKNAEKTYGKNIFTHTEIKDLCIKYDLRLLNTKYYKGLVSSEFPDKVIEFANANNLRIGLNGDTWNGDADKFLILAPRENFKHKKRIKNEDPILFFYVGNNMYKVVYAWGNSLKNSRVFKGWVKRNSKNRRLFFSSLIASFFLIFFGGIGLGFLLGLLISSIIGYFGSLIFMPWHDERINHDHSFFTEGEYRSTGNFMVQPRNIF